MVEKIDATFGNDARSMPVDTDELIWSCCGGEWAMWCLGDEAVVWSGVTLRWRYLGGYVARERRARLQMMSETSNDSKSSACTIAACAWNIIAQPKSAYFSSGKDG